MSFLFDLAQYLLAPTDDSGTLSKIALQGMEEGYESLTLHILAGLKDKENPFIVDGYLKKMLEELNLNFNKEQAALLLIKLTIDKIQKIQLDPYDGAKFIFGQVLWQCDFRNRDEKYVYDSIGLAKVYGLYVQIDDLRNPYYKWDSPKDIKTLIAESKIEMKELLEEWIAPVLDGSPR